MSKRGRKAEREHDELDPEVPSEAEPREMPASEAGVDDAVEGNGEAAAAGPSELEQKAKEAAEAHEKYLRTYADFENYRKRAQRELQEFRKYANEQMALDLLTVVDHLALAIRHAQESGGNAQGLQEGVELVHKQFLDVLEKHGIKPFKAEGERFDPASHDAMMQVESADVPENTVVQVFQDGYRYHDKVLRHARVGVSRRPAAPPPASGDAEEE